jgi:hypothetical protein
MYQEDYWTRTKIHIDELVSFACGSMNDVDPSCGQVHPIPKGLIVRLVSGFSTR